MKPQMKSIAVVVSSAAFALVCGLTVSASQAPNGKGTSS